MKKVIIVNASPRQDGNSDFIEETLKKEMKNTEIRVFRLRDKDVRPCKACCACKAYDKPFCIQKDDMEKLIPELDSCDGIVLISPVYFHMINGPAKTLIDRLYCFFNPSKPEASVASKRGKKAALICPSGGGPVEEYTKMAESVVKDFAVTGVDETKVYICGDVNEPGSCKDKPDQIKAVCEMAEWLEK